MSAPVIGVALKVVGVVMAGKALVTGLKEGNLLQAALGAVGAYMGLNGLGAFSNLGTGVATNTVGAQAVGELGKDLVVNNASSLNSALGTAAADTAMRETATMTADQLLSAAPSVLDKGLVAGGMASSAGSGLAGGSMFGADAALAGMPSDIDLLSGFGADPSSAALAEAGVGAAEKTGLIGRLSQGMDWMEEHPELMKLGGQMLAGMSEGERTKYLLEWRKKLEAEERARRGYSAATPTNLQQYTVSRGAGMF